MKKFTIHIHFTTKNMTVGEKGWAKRIRAVLMKALDLQIESIDVVEDRHTAQKLAQIDQELQYVVTGEQLRRAIYPRRDQ